MRILTIDIETIPNKVWSWELYKAFIGPEQVIEPGRVICFSAKWLDDDVTMFSSEYRAERSLMVAKAWKLLGEADAVIHYNGTTFDVPKLNREFELYHLGPPPPYKQIDLLQTARKVFSLSSNKLGYVVKEFGVGEKVANEGWPLWQACIDGDADAWERMERYNRGDVIATEALYRRWLPWIPSVPSFGAFTGTDVCPACGSTELVRQGYAMTRTGRYQRYQCPQCGKWSRATRRESGTKITEVAA